MVKLNTFLKKSSDELLTLSEFATFQQAKENLAKDKKAFEIIKNIKERKQTKLILEQQGLPFSDEQEIALKELFSEMRANTICMNYLKASNQALKAAQTICNHYSSVTQIPFTSGGGCC